MTLQPTHREVPAHSLPGDLHPVLQRVYAARGVVTADELELTLARLLPPDFLGMDAAAELLADAIDAQADICIVGDYDADGATGTAVAMLGLAMLGAENVRFVLPDRFALGYGLSEALAVQLLEDAPPDVVITVDNGIASIAGVRLLESHGTSVIVTDHHLAGEELPPAQAIVNPNQPGCPFPSKAVAGVGVMFYVLLALRRVLRERGIEPAGGKRIAELLDLVALGTVADVVPLDLNNRILVQQGLLRIRAGHGRPGIVALARVAGRDPAKLHADDFGFALAPRLNAAGRLADMSVGVRCLLADSDAEAAELAAELDTLNRERRGIEAEMREDALMQLKAAGELLQDDPFAICLFDPGWHEGVVGILAARLRERLGRPAVAFAPGSDEGEIKGSARSIPGVHIRDALALLDARQPDLLLKYGGHAMAAGMTIRQADLSRFRRGLNQAVATLVGNQLPGVTLETDGELTADEMNLDTALLLERAGPFGQGFPPPCFDGVFEVRDERRMGENHVRLRLAPAGAAVNRACEAVAFHVDTDTFPFGARRLRVVYRLASNEYQGLVGVQLVVEAAERA